MSVVWASVVVYRGRERARHGARVRPLLGRAPPWLQSAALFGGLRQPLLSRVAGPDRTEYVIASIRWAAM